MFIRVFLQEFLKNIKSPAFYIFFAILFGSTIVFTMTTDPNTSFMGVSHGKEWHNAPIIIAQLFARLSVFGLLFTMIIIGRSVAKDFEANIHELIFSRPVSKFQYLGGRFFGSYAANFLLFLSIVLGFEIGLAFMDPKYAGPFRPGAYLLPLIFTIIPNLMLLGVIMFSLATLTRKMISTYLAAVAFLAVYSMIGVMLHRMDNETLKVLLDPFGITALSVYTKFWTVTDMNADLMPLKIPFLINRLIWLGVSFVILIYTFKKFRFIAFLERKSRKKSVQKEETEIINYDLPQPKFVIIATIANTFIQCLKTSWKDLKRILVHPAFLILTFLALSQIVGNFIGQLGNSSGHIYPFTSWYLRQTVHLWMYMLPLTIFFGGMLFWKERDHQTDEIMFTLPVPNWFGFTNKFLTLASIQALYLLLAIITGVVTQVFFMDFKNIELDLYFKQLFGVDFLSYLYLAIIVLFIQNLSPNKYIGFFLSALYIAVDVMIFDVFGFSNYLFRYGRVPDFVYSNMNGFGHFGQTIFWYNLYWLFFGTFLAWLTILLWRRTNENSIVTRMRYFVKHVTRDQKKGLAIVMVLFIVTGFYIGYNKYVVNPHFTEKEWHEMQADYEKKFSVYMYDPQPTITDINLKIDLFPHERVANVKGDYLLENNTAKNIKDLYVNLNDWNVSNLKPLSFNRGFEKKLHASEFGFRVFELDPPLVPGDTVRFTFNYDIIASGFTDNQPKNEIVDNGTCLILSSFSSSYFPLIGYSINAEILSDQERKKHDLPEKADAPKIAEANRNKSIIEVCRPNYEAVISTSSNQVIISGGHLVKQWRDDTRNYFHYKTDTIIENEIAIISGNYAVQRENYNGINVEVYYHPEHDFNIQRIIDGLKDSYDYGNKYFSKYPYNDVRVVEIPRYMTEGAARHFPTTFIWKESEGFITRYQDDDIDIVYAIAAHENAHHWWAGIVTPAYAEGAFLLTESIAQYVMAMTLEKKYGKKISRKYLKNEMDSYLIRRKKDQEGEKPLLESSVQQAYLGYKKSSPVMYALQDYIGEDSVGAALGRVVGKYGFALNNFPLASDLLEEFDKVTPDSLKYLVDDLFRKITLYENSISAAECTRLNDHEYLVNLEVKTNKFYADSVGAQIEAPLNDYIYVALMDDDGEAFYYEKHRFDNSSTHIQIVTDRVPAKAGIDPYLVLIDRDGDNNVCDVEMKRENTDG